MDPDTTPTFTPLGITETTNTTPLPPKRSIFKILIILLLFAIVTLYGAYRYTLVLNQPPVDFPMDRPITIETGTDVRAITEVMADAHVVRSSALLYYTIILFHEPKNIKASVYQFDVPLTTFAVAKRLTEGDFDSDLVRFTHIEGERASLLASRAAEVLPQFNEERFLANTEKLEGKLWPETYFIPEDFTDEDLLDLMLETFTEKTEPLADQIAVHRLTLEEILVLASIVEREANTPESMKMVSGVLQNRLETGMPLQADASIEYILDKPLSELTPEDLEIETPYNTYLNLGLPPTPIGNPGLDAIMAVLEPTESENFYYITGDDGEFYYAKTYTEHLRNIDRHLR
ncbi:endolytic transglycosylase MltG [Candidatus Kaiserbacteria bacterium]|nr:endolytic transglycosylase MltG [Candidatus Kaiserbacteria bacterium]